MQAIVCVLGVARPGTYLWLRASQIQFVLKRQTHLLLGVRRTFMRNVQPHASQILGHLSRPATNGTNNEQTPVMERRRCPK